MVYIGICFVGTWKDCAFCYSWVIEVLWRVEVHALHLAFGGMGEGTSSFLFFVFFVVFGWSGTVIIYNFFVLLGCPYIGSLVTENRLLWEFCFLHLLTFPGCCLLQHLIWNIWGQKKTQRAHNCVVPWVLRLLAGLSLSLNFLEFSYVYFMYNV